VQSDPNTQHVSKAMEAMECVIVQDLFLNETARFAHVFLPGLLVPGKGRHLHQCRAAHLAGAQGHEAEVGLCRLGSHHAAVECLGYPMNYGHPSEIMDEIARLTPTFKGVSYEKLDRLGSIQWPCNDAAPEGTPTMHIDQFVRGKGASW
jgi:formate dehydrogenase major subunit